MDASVLTRWEFDPAVILGLVLAAVLYWRGRRLSIKIIGGRAPNHRPWQTVAFAAGLLTIFLALQSPIGAYDDSLFWVHMIQHVLLFAVAAPLLSLGDSIVPLMRGTPLTLRRKALGALSRQPWARRLGAVFSWLRRPRQILAIFVVDMYFWHWSWLFNLTLTNQAIHDLEHLSFLVTGLLFWSQIVDQRTVHTQLGYVERALYVVIAGFSTNFLAMFFVFAPRPLYSGYAGVVHRPGGITALADQQYAGAIMWVPVLFLFGVAFSVCMFKWLGQDEALYDLPNRSTPARSALRDRVDGTAVRLP
ncbi:MAG: cytochrome c oxidase assembly protein [Chloroflexota bacterium]